MMQFIQDRLCTLKARMLVLLDPRVQTELIAEGRPDREQLIADLREIEQLDRQEAAAYESKINSLARELRAVEQQAAKLQRQIDQECTQQQLRRFERDARIDRIRRALADGCPAQVDELLARVTADIETLQQSHRIEPCASRRLAALRDARQQAEALRTAPLSTEEVLTRLRHIEANIPAASQERGLVAAV